MRISDIAMNEHGETVPMTAPRAAAERWIAVVIMFASLVALAAIPEAGGLMAAALMWIVAFAILEHAKRTA